MVDIQETNQKARKLALNLLRERISELHAFTEQYSSNKVLGIDLDSFRDKLNAIDDINTLIYNLDQLIND